MEGDSAYGSNCCNGIRRSMRRRVSFHPDVTKGLVGGDGPAATSAEKDADEALAAFRAELHATRLAHATHENSRTASGEERRQSAGCEASSTRPSEVPSRNEAPRDGFTQRCPAAEHASADFPGSALELSVAEALASTHFAGGS
jgi:hypothetical protein